MKYLLNISYPNTKYFKFTYVLPIEGLQICEITLKNIQIDFIKELLKLPAHVVKLFFKAKN